jgi:hypothetical protein
VFLLLVVAVVVSLASVESPFGVAETIPSLYSSSSSFCHHVSYLHINKIIVQL